MSAEDREKAKPGKPFIEVLRHVAADRWSNRPDGREADRRTFVVAFIGVGAERRADGVLITNGLAFIDQAVGIANDLERRTIGANLVALARDVRAGDASKEEVFLDALEEHPVDLDRARLRLPVKKTIQANRVVNGVFVGKAPLEYFNKDVGTPVVVAAGIVVAMADDRRLLEDVDVVERAERSRHGRLESQVHDAIMRAEAGMRVSITCRDDRSVEMTVDAFERFLHTRVIQLRAAEHVLDVLRRISFDVVAPTVPFASYDGHVGTAIVPSTRHVLLSDVLHERDFPIDRVGVALDPRDVPRVPRV